MDQLLKLFRPILGQGGTNEDLKINRKKETCKNTKHKDGQLQKRNVSNAARLKKNGGPNGCRITMGFEKE